MARSSKREREGPDNVIVWKEGAKRGTRKRGSLSSTD